MKTLKQQFIIRVIMLILVSLVMKVSKAQITQVENKASFEKVGEVKMVKRTWVILSKSDQTYMVSYQDTDYTQIVKLDYFVFDEIDNDLERLYNLIIDGLEKIPEDDIKLELPEHTVWLTFSKSMAGASVQFTSSKNGGRRSSSIGMTRKHIDKLFGRDDKANK